MTARRVSRRDAAAGGVAMLVLAAAAAGQAKAEELDGELLVLCNEYHSLQERMRATDLALADFPPGSPEGRLWLATIRPLVSRCSDVRWDIINTQAVTPEGLQAKARVVAADLAGGADPEQSCFDLREGLAVSLARDILGRAGA